MEFSGRNTSGKRVIGLVPGGALATSVIAHKDLIWEIPDEWSLEEACTVPRTYSMVSLKLFGIVKLIHFLIRIRNIGLLCTCCERKHSTW